MYNVIIVIYYIYMLHLFTFLHVIKIKKDITVNESYIKYLRTKDRVKA